MKQLSDDILRQLKSQGSRITKARSLIVSAFLDSDLPQTEAELRQRLAKRGTNVNKTTVYRELEHLRSRGFVREVDFGDRKKRYELDGKDHHHHLVCTSCKKVDEVHIESDLAGIERQINRKKNFKIVNHSLEFFGLCGKCAR